MGNREESPTFGSLLADSERFIVTCEHVPGRLSGGKKIDDILAFADRCRETGLVQALSLTDNPGGTPALSPDMLAAEIENAGLTAMVHFSLKDMNRNLAESRALALDRSGVRTLLVMSGDYPVAGTHGVPMPVFDCDPVQALTFLGHMNRGIRLCADGRIVEGCAPTSFCSGAVVSPFKFTEPGTMLQYYKMEKKIRAGAQFLVTQLGFDAAGLSDLMSYLRERSYETPVIGSVFILRRLAAGAMNRGDIPGSYVTDALLSEIQKEAEAPDKGRAASLERAAMQVAVLRGLGFRGAHIEAMILTFDMVETILGRADELAPSWEECAAKLNYAPSGSFYRNGPVAATAGSSVTPRLGRGRMVYGAMRLLHGLLFSKGNALGSLMRGVSRLLDTVRPLGALSHMGEHVLKVVLFDCRDCGDCALPELQFLCPQSQCPKQQRNGPCGGSRLDACEVYSDRPCVWHRVYTRAKRHGELESLRQTIVGPRDWALNRTSGWVNFHLDRDHTGIDFGALMGRKGEEQAASSKKKSDG